MKNSIEFTIDENGAIRFTGHLCVPQKADVKMNILREAHWTLYTIHPGGTKMYRDLKLNFWWKRMKVDITKYVAACGVYQQVKAKHKRLVGLMQFLEIPEWKWEHITMDFVIGLLIHLEAEMPFGLSWIGYPNLHISSQ